MTTRTVSIDETDLGSLMSRMTGDDKHSAAATSTLTALWVLYDEVLDVHPGRTGDPDRDRFFLSKGHGPMAYYAVLAAKGFIGTDELDDWATFDSRLGLHPDGVLVPGIEIGSGSLGHGLPLGVGTALGLRAQGRDRPRVVVLIGDAELDEGSNQEVIALAGRIGLGSLTVVVVDNRSSTHGWPGGIAARFTVEGWSGSTVDGHDPDALRKALTDTKPEQPLVVVATVAPKDSPQGTVSIGDRT